MGLRSGRIDLYSLYDIVQLHPKGWKQSCVYKIIQDGDTVTIKGIFSVEANEELDRVMNSKYNFITSGNIGIRTSSNEAIQSLYNLTLVLEDDAKKMTPTDRITFA